MTPRRPYSPSSHTGSKRRTSIRKDLRRDAGDKENSRSKKRLGQQQSRLSSGNRPSQKNVGSRPQKDSHPQNKKAGYPQQLSQSLGADWRIVLKGEGKTRQFSVRIIFLVLACMLAIVIVANPLRTFISQQETKREMVAVLEERTKRERELRNEIDLWKNPLFVQAQARERIGYVMPGQTLYVVEQEKAKDGETAAAERATKLRKERLAATPFYLTMWESLQLAGEATKKKAEDLENTPLLRKPEGQKPEGQKPEGRKPEGQKPEGQKPEGQKPEGQTKK